MAVENLRFNKLHQIQERSGLYVDDHFWAEHQIWNNVEIELLLYTSVVKRRNPGTSH